MFRTISFDDRNLIDMEEMDLFIAFLENSYPNVHKSLKRTRINDYSLLFEWQGKDARTHSFSLSTRYLLRC
jgi:carboxypeptidase PM20D1